MLLVRTRRGLWTLPGGKVAPEEEPWRAAAREAREEAGVEGSVQVDPIAWVSVRKGLAGLLRRRSTLTPVFLLEVRELGKPEERFRDPTWWRLDQVERALRHGRTPWSRRWLVRAARAAAANIGHR